MQWKDYHIISAINAMNRTLVEWKIVKQRKMTIKISKKKSLYVENVHQLREEEVLKTANYMEWNS